MRRTASNRLGLAMWFSIILLATWSWGQNAGQNGGQNAPAPAAAPPAAAPSAQTAPTAGPLAPAVAPVAPPADATAPAQTAPPAGGDSAGSLPADQSVPASDQPANDGGTFVFKKQVQEVILHATVVDQDRHLVPNLDKSAFSVMEDGAPQPITAFGREDVPVAMGILVDNSGSMRDKRDEVNRAVLNLIRASNPEDEIFVVNFSQNYYLDQDFTSNVNLLQTALHQVSSAGSTALYDAVVASTVHLNNNPRLDKKVLLVITDGEDNMSQQTLQEALRRIQRPNGPIVYALGLTGGGLQEPGRQALENLAAGTGGVAYFPASIDQVASITSTVARDIRSQYMIVYRPKNQDSKPSYQSVQVQARAPGYGPLTVRTKSGYFAGQPHP